MSPTANYAGLERRVCPNCRLYFDTERDSKTVFCSAACRRRHNTGELRADGSTKRVIKRELAIEECLNGHTRAESNLDDEAIEDFVAWSKDIERRAALRELARDRLDDDDLPRADSLLWVDRAEVYALCSGCYFENQDGAWTGSTRNPNYEELRATMNDRLSEGCPCTFCKSDRVDELKDKLADEVAVEIEVIDGE